MILVWILASVILTIFGAALVVASHELTDREFIVGAICEIIGAISFLASTFVMYSMRVC